MQTLEFKDLCSKIYPLNFDLNWIDCNGNKIITDHEIKIDNYSIYLSCQIDALAHFDAGDYLTPPDFSVQNINTEINDLTLIESDTLEPVKLLFCQNLIINSLIQENINV